MTGRRLCYCLALLAGLVFYIAYGAWFSALVLALLLGLPWLSLVLSLPAMVRFHLEPEAPGVLTQGEPGEAWLLGRCPWPMPPFRGKLWLRSAITGEVRRCYPGQSLPTDHCGGFTLTVTRARVCDYLGVFALPVRRAGTKAILVRPRPLPLGEIPDLQKFAPRTWRPKPGGGFAENHELRLYRPGDSLNQVHWKLTAKTGKLTIREPMEPQRGPMLLTLTLRGTPQELDRKFGRLLWLGTFLAEQGVGFEIRALTGNGILSLTAEDPAGVYRAIDALLCTPQAREGSIRDKCYPAAWQYHIGGEPDAL